MLVIEKIENSKIQENSELHDTECERESAKGKEGRALRMRTETGTQAGSEYI